MLFTLAAAAQDGGMCPAPARPQSPGSLLELNQFLSGRSNECDLTTKEQRTYATFTGLTFRAPNSIEDLRFAMPRLKMDAAFEARGDCAKKQAVLSCAARYASAMQSLENAIAHAAIKEPAVLAMARKLAGRLEMLIRARATREVLGDTRKQANATEQGAIERLVNDKMKRAFGTCTIDQAGCLAGECTGADSSACLARQNARIQQAVKSGNLREAMFFLYQSNGALTENVSRPTAANEIATNVASENQTNLQYLNSYVRERGEDWQVSNVPLNYQGAYILKRTGYGADNNRMRDRRTLPDGKPGCVSSTARLREAPVPSLEFEALSARESAALSERLHVDQRALGDQVMPYYSGESCFILKTEITDPAYAKYNSLLTETRDAKIPMLTGISGTTDSLLTLGRTLGLKSRDDFEVLRAAALGWLVSSRDHSVHEVMTASRSFTELPPYTFRPDAYKDILPTRPGFARAVEAYQRQRGQPMPQNVLDTCLRTREAAK